MDSKTRVLSKEELDTRISELGAKITQDYAGKELVLLGVLNGAFIFLADLCRTIDLDLEVDFIRVASYGNKTHSSGTIRLTKPTELDLSGKHIILVEDIVDTGNTMAWLVNHFSEMGAASVKICTLIDKNERREVDIVSNYVGFSLDRGYLVGFGLDHAERYRNLPEIFSLDV